MHCVLHNRSVYINVDTLNTQITQPNNGIEKPRKKKSCFIVNYSVNDTDPVVLGMEINYIEKKKYNDAEKLNFLTLINE